MVSGMLFRGTVSVPDAQRYGKCEAHQEKIARLKKLLRERK